MDFSYFVLIYDIEFLTRYPKPASDAYLVLKIFKLETWAFMLGSYLVASLLLYLIVKYHNIYENEMNNSTNGSYISQTFSIVFKSLVFQGSSHNINSSSGRLIHGPVLLVALTIGYIYSGTLTSVLSMPRFEKIPTTIEEIVKQGFQVWVHKNYVEYDIMKSSPLNLVTQLFEEAELETELEIGIPAEDEYIRAQEGNLAFLSSWPSNQIKNKGALFGTDVNMYGKRKPCTIRRVREPIYLLQFGFVLPRNSPLAELFDSRLLSLHAANLIGSTGNEKLYEEGFGQKCLTPPAPAPETKPFNLNHLAGAFVILASGIILSVAVFALETLYWFTCYKRPHIN